MAEPIRMNMSQPHMNTNHDILTLTQWLSPAYPVGAFTYAHGLEAAVHSGLITSGEHLRDWLDDVVSHGSGRNDCILLRAAFNAVSEDDLRYVNDVGLAFAAAAERQLETRHLGMAFCKTTTAIWDALDVELIYPVAIGKAASQRNIDPTLTCALYLQAMAGNLVSCAQRLMPLGQTEGQAIIAALTARCDEIAAATCVCTLHELQSSAFLSDISALQHETLQPRIFRT